MEIMKNVEEELGVTATIVQAEFLEKIVEYIDTHGHVKKVLAHNERRCLLGAALVVNKEMQIIRDDISSELLTNGCIMTGLQLELAQILGEPAALLNDNPKLEWPDIRDIVLNKAKDLRNNERIT